MKRTITGFALALLLLAAGGLRAEEKKVDVKGYLQEMYSANSNSTADSFSMRLARIVFCGKPSADWSYQFQLDALSSVSLLDAYLDYSREGLLPAPLALKVRAGQFRIPFSMENLAPDSELDTVNRSQAVNNLAPARDLGTKGRDIGAYAQLSASPWGVKRLAELTVGQFNGEGANAADKNNHKGLALRGVIAPSPALSFGASVYEGNRFSTATAHDRTGYELSASYGPAVLKAEYVKGKDSYVSKEGWYGQLSCFVIPKKLMLVGKYDFYDPSLAKARDGAAVTTAGANWYFAEGMRLQANYEWKYWEKGSKMTNTAYAVLALTF